MPVDFANIKLKAEYTRPELAEIWGYKGYEAISRGIVTPAGTPYVILFITKEKQTSFTQYEDVFADGILEIEGETSRAADQRIIQSENRGDEMHLFYREKHHMPFKHDGRIYLTDYKIYSDRPSRFRFAVDRETASADSSIATEEETHGTADSLFSPDTEGRKRLRQHISYERSRKNRARAIKIHGTSCLACGFTFNEVYGADFAKDFIEVHHVKSLAEQNDAPVDPEKDLIPLCSNCHSMAHREKGKILSLEELRVLLSGSITKGMGER